MDPRHEERITIVQNLFAHCFHIEGQNTLPHPEDKTTNIIIQRLAEIDAHIAKHAPKYPLDRIAKADLSILRLSVYELIVNKKEPTKVIINEAVELAKELGGDRSYAFVNAVLGSILTEFETDDTQEITEITH